ncbi:YcaO-like family protein [Kitasatospora sp. NRRL B-11411]|uniref:YcaO-like family protein n=1 Tax=Kitasatospora sp. NRRL B-11411 TaxID=1463822 RepID=UPI00068A1D04|nr:YcaO-like family protein [Kitasatospora sp. NRRL B-11411]
MTALSKVHELAGPFAAVPVLPRRLPASYLPPWWHSFVSASAPFTVSRPYPRTVKESHGSGRSGDAETAWRISAVETLERLANYTVQREFPVSDAASLPTAIDLDTVPRCSARELADPRCRLTLPDRHQPIRWAEGVRVATGEKVHLPAVMTRLGLPPMPGERFWAQISTGVAAGGSWESALASGICEVIERDMIAVTWHQRLRLPRVDPGVLTPEGARLVEWCDRKFVRVHVFDATSEIGVPTVYCVQEAPHDPVARRIVSAATHVDLPRAVEHAIGEGMSIRTAVHNGAQKKPEDRGAIIKGAVEIGAPEMAHALDFLLGGHGPRPPRPVTAPPSALLEDDAARLRHLVERCERAGHEVYAVDLTTPELRSIGLHVAGAVIPGLQPLAFNPHAQYRGHPRLYRLPELLGHPVRAEDDLNPHPQPFA